MTGSIDGTIIIRDTQEIEKKISEIKTNRVVNFLISKNETHGYSLDGDRKSITRFCLQ